MEYEAAVKGPLKLKGTANKDIQKKLKKKNKEKVKNEGESSKPKEPNETQVSYKQPVVKTKAQLKFEQMKEEQQKKRILEKASKTHKQRFKWNAARYFTQTCSINSDASLCQNAASLKVDQLADIKESELKEISDPLKFPDYFGVRKLFRIKDLFDARIHYGHTNGTLDPNMKPYIFGSRLGHLIFDLDKTAEMLQDALNFTAHIAYRGGIILFVSHCPQHTLTVENAAKQAGEYAHAREWDFHIFTNSEKVYNGVTRLPDLVILLSTLNPQMQEHTAVKDAAKMCIPTIGIVDSNSNPNLITYPIPGNDDSPAAVQLYCNLFRDAILLGKSKKPMEVY
ncbi:28S ribosomal protein S2, mitochondrial [Daphnia magna]|uniref:Small ribosomal subunit protein uS2m n=1 Tax=Daphnia magna TaxID=35525 RepID=A0A4Y7MF37_9CRUS|nr:28S ribosomal protein S2, mitochondrial [Daphnia magna]SVE80307.1 EOG090X0B5N [Daphnia magna]SVE80898.1 EOG090X0B5N [Daphnia magna]